MAAVVVLTLALFAVMSVNAMTLRQTRYNESLQTANTIATSQLAIAESVLKVNFRADTNDIGTGWMQSVTFPDFKYRIVDGGFVAGSNQRLRSLTVVVAWMENGTNRDFQLSTIFYDY
jgi:hypothetical protein